MLANQPVPFSLIRPKIGRQFRLPLIAFRVPVGFPSPADDYLEDRIDLNDYLIRHPAATFFARVDGDSMEGAGILDADLIVSEKGADIVSGCIVFARIGDEFTVKRFVRKGSRGFLMAENAKYPPIEITGELDFEIWGRVVAAVKEF